MAENTTACAGCSLRDAAVSRRDFVSMATLTAVAAVLTACGGGSDGSTAPATGDIAISLASFPELATVGQVAKVRNSPPVALARTSSGLVAFSMACTHQGTTVVIDSDKTIFCPNHGATFTFAGVWTGGERTSNLRRLPVSVDGGGTTATITLG